MTTLATTFVRKRSPQVGARIRNFLLAGLVPWLVVACGNRNIDLVKAEMVPGGNYTYGQALDNNKSCADTTWKSYKDDKQRDMVGFHCEVVVPKTVLTPFLDKLAKKLEEERRTLLRNYDSYVAEIQKDLVIRQQICVIDQSNAQATREDNRTKLAALENGTYRPSEYGMSYTLESIQRKIAKDEKYAATQAARCTGETAGLQRALAPRYLLPPETPD